MVKVLIADKMAPVAADIFRARGIDVETKLDLTPEDLGAVLGQYDGVAVRSATRIGAPQLQTPGVLKVIGRAGIGVDTIDVPAATRAGIVVMNTPFGNSVTTAEHTIAMVMALVRQIPQAHESTRAGKWEKSRFMGTELQGKTLGVIGCGNIGAIVADRALGLKMKVIAADPFLTQERARALGVEKVELDELYARADLITIHTPMTDSTRGIINAATLAKMKKGVFLINVARGGLMVETDLKAGLDSGRIAGVALDVFETEPARENILFDHPNVICTPHLGASTGEAQISVAREIAQQMADFLLTGAIANAVNMPAISAGDAPRLRPYMDLATVLGQLAGQIAPDNPRTIEILYRGQAADLTTRPLPIRPLTACLLAALLGQGSDSVNRVNALDMARARGLGVTESRADMPGDTPAAPLRLTVTGEKSVLTITGALLAEGHPRIVEIDGIDIEAAPAPYMLLIRNKDQPGMIGGLGTLLAQRGHNIADFRLGRDKIRGHALALVTLDTPPDAATLSRIRDLPMIEQASLLHFS